jgi:hypothetical protein
LEALRTKLVEAEKRAAVAEAVAEERERIIAVQAQALRMLEAPKPTVQEPPAPLSEPVADAAKAIPLEPTRRRWWKR